MSVYSEAGMTSLRKRKTEVGRRILKRRIVNAQEDLLLWNRMLPVGREFGSADFERLMEGEFCDRRGTAYGIVKRGVPSRALVALGDYLGIGRGDLVDVLDVDRSTAYRKVASNQPLPLHAAESVLRLLELQCLPEDTFDSLEAANAWLRRVHPMLDGETPLGWVKSAYGAERVKEILLALKYSSAV
jgi:putative toxin-antitoxin system antitoxin component (TIGR02293 family)